MSHHGREDERRYTDQEAEVLANKAWARRSSSAGAARYAIRTFLERWDQCAEDSNLRDAAAELRAWAIRNQVVEAPDVAAQRRAKRQAELDAQIARLQAERAKL